MNSLAFGFGIQVVLAAITSSVTGFEPGIKPKFEPGLDPGLGRLKLLVLELKSEAKPEVKLRVEPVGDI